MSTLEIRFVHIEFRTGEHEEILVVQLGKIDDHIVVGDAEDIIATLFVEFLHLLRRHAGIGDVGVGVQIGAEIFRHLGQQIHTLTPFFLPRG